MCAVQVVEQHIAVLRVFARRKSCAVFQQDMAFEAELRRCRRRLARVVGLRRALGDDRVGALARCLAHQEFELAGLVAASGKPRAIVALDPQAWPPQMVGKMLRKPFHRLQRRRQMRELYAGETCEMHGKTFLRSLNPCRAGPDDTVQRRQHRIDFLDGVVVDRPDAQYPFIA